MSFFESLGRWKYAQEARSARNKLNANSSQSDIRRVAFLEDMGKVNVQEPDDVNDRTWIFPAVMFAGLVVMVIIMICLYPAV